MNDNITDKSTYSTYLANYGRNSYIPVESNSKGELGWSTEIPLKINQHPRSVMVWEGNLVVETESSIIVYDNKGNFLWERSKVFRSPIAIGNKLLYYENENFFLDVVDTSNKLAYENVSIPEAANENYPIYLFAPEKETFIAAIQFVGGEDGTPAEARFHKTQFGDRISTWEHGIEGTLSLPPLYIAEVNKLVIFMKDILYFDTDTGKKISQINFPLESPLNCCAGNDGMLYMLGYENNQIVLAAFTDDGIIKWRWTDRSAGKTLLKKQPSILGADNIIYVLAADEVFAVNRHKLLWSFAPEEKTISYGTALADGSLLLTAGNSLYRLDSKGDTMFSIDFEKTILAPPAVDRNGKIYIAMSDELALVR